MSIAKRSLRWGLLCVSALLCAGSAYVALQSLDALQAEKKALESTQLQLKNAQKASAGMATYKAYDERLHALIARVEEAGLLPGQWLRNPIDMKKSVMSRKAAVSYLTDMGNSQYTLLRPDTFDLHTVHHDDDLYHYLRKSGDVSLTMKGEYLTRRIQE